MLDHVIPLGLTFRHENDPEQTANIVKAYQDRKHTMGHYRSWIGLPGAQNSTLPKQHEITMTENRRKSRQHP